MILIIRGLWTVSEKEKWEMFTDKAHKIMRI
jgi:hypothetical protein